MYSAKAAGLLEEFADHGGDNKITFPGDQAGDADNIAEHKGQGFSERRLYFHLSASNQIATTARLVSNPHTCAGMVHFAIAPARDFRAKSGDR
jgi:hypothetical protein